jgi:hypothetical protein
MEDQDYFFFEEKMRRKILYLAALLAIAVVVGSAYAQLSVVITSVGNVVGQTKELTISAQTSVAVFGTATVLPACAIAAASSFQDIATTSLNWGTGLASNGDYETFFCIGNIGTSAGTITATVTNGANGETLTCEQVTAGLVGGLTASALSGVSLAGNGVIVVRAHLHSPTVGLNGSSALSSKLSMTFA